MTKVLIAPITLANLDGPWLRLLRESGFTLSFPANPKQMTEDELDAQLADVDAVIAGSEPYTRRVLAAHPTLRVIARAGVGYDAVDVAAATEHGKVVTITPNTNQDAVAEQTFALMLALAKDVVNQHIAVKAGGWPRRANLPLRGRTLGIAGLGRIGKAVAVRGACFGMRLLGYEPYPDPEFNARYNITLVPFERLLAESDYLTLHVPLMPESKYVINQRTLAQMKPTALLINTARGGLVCEADLVEALRARRIAGAALDVFEEEPPPKGHALFGLDNLIVTAHTAGVDVQSRDDMALSAVQAIVDLSRGQWPVEKVVNPQVRSKFQW
jgi:phosphoglycerate dehydrogenase-like enzyme